MRVPSLLSPEPLLAKCSMVPNMPAVKTPLDIPKKKTTEFSISGSVNVSPRNEIIKSESAEKRHPVISHSLSDPKRLARQRTIEIIPISVPIL